MRQENKFWVSMTDKFMSGWGRAAGLINKYVVECDNYEQALCIERHAEQRNEMKYINICSNFPRYNEDTHLMTLEHYNDLGDVWKK